MSGKLLTYILLALALGSAGAYFLSVRQNSEKLKSIGRYAFYALAGGIAGMVLMLLANIFSHNFQYTYIWSYSSTTLPMHLLVSSFYAGQEGSFLLWTFLLAVIGVFLIPNARKYGYESWVMGFYSVILLFLLMILIFKSPFEMIWETFAGQQGVQVGFTPPEGRGLNPILQNYWIAIHPPILFLGYAAMTVPFVFAIAGLIKREYNEWINIAIPWTLFAAAILGLGIMMGGFWAYETLGWGGFWAWDPVENASLMPWLIATALIHTMLVQKRTGGLYKTNFSLAILGFIFVLFATYLTRSGILGEASVHSFVDPGQIVNNLMVFLLLFFTISGFTILFIRMKDIPQAKIGFSFSSKEMWLALGSILLLALTVIVLLGTIRPILPEWLVKTKASVKPEDYNMWANPISLLILILNAVSIYLNWKQSDWKAVFKKLYFPIIASVVIVVISYFLGLSDYKYILLGFAGWFSFFVNIELCIKNFKSNPKYLGAFVSHLGISVMILGIIASGAYSEMKPLSLVQGRTQKAFEYDITLVGKKQIEKQLADREKYEYQIRIEKNGKVLADAYPVLYYSSFNNFESPFFEPGIERFLMKDLYISPKTFDLQVGDPPLVLKKGESGKLAYDTTITMTFNRFEMNQQHNEKEMVLGTIISFEKDGKQWDDTLFATLNPEKGKMTPVTKLVKGTDFQLSLSSVVPGETAEDTKIEFLASREVFHIDISTKPFINLVWFGVIAVVLGFFVAMFRYVNAIKKTKQAAVVQEVPKDETEG
jgi:cytochrome c-type biogenesis protein CcmF